MLIGSPYRIASDWIQDYTIRNWKSDNFIGSDTDRTLIRPSKNILIYLFYHCKIQTPYYNIVSILPNLSCISFVRMQLNGAYFSLHVVKYLMFFSDDHQIGLDRRPIRLDRITLSDFRSDPRAIRSV